MRKYLFTILLYIIFLSPLIYTQEWTKITPTFHPEGDFDMSRGTFVKENIGWCTGFDDGRIWKTTDGGYNWFLQKDTTKNESVYYFHFNDTLNGLAFGNGIWKTTDGGEEWVKVSDSLAGRPFFINAQEGFSARKENILKTKDYGNNWDVVFRNPLYQFNFSDIFFIDDSIGWAVGGISIWSNEDYYIYKTKDKGNTWKEVFNSSTKFLNEIYFKDENHGLAIGFFNAYYTEDGGETWQESSYSSIFYNLFFTDKDKVWATDYDLNGIIYTKDIGKNWYLEYSMNNFQPFTVIFLESEKLGYSFGFDQLLLKYDALSSIKEGNSNIPDDFNLFNNYPNPFNPSTNIVFNLRKRAHVQLKIFDILGNEVITLIDKEMLRGKHIEKWDGKNDKNEKVNSGIYICRLITEKESKSIKMLLMK